MPTRDERQRRQHDEELDLARRLMVLPLSVASSTSSRWSVETFQKWPESVGATLVASETRPDSVFRIHLAQTYGPGLVARVLLTQCSLELLRRTEGVDLVPLNNYYLRHRPHDQSFVAAATLAFDRDEPKWSGSFAGIDAPVAVDALGRVIPNSGMGPFLGLAETTFPILSGQLPPGGRLFIVGGAGANHRMEMLREHLADTQNWSLTELVERLGRELTTELDPAFGFVLIGVERNGACLPLPAPDADVE